MKQVSFSKVIGDEGIFVDGDWVESKDQDPNGSVRLIQLADIGDGIFINKSNRYLTLEKAKELKCTFLNPGDLLIARMPDPIGRACIFPGLEMPCITVVDVCIVRPDKKQVIPEYLKFLINNNEFRNRINKYITGTTRQRISRSNLEKITFDLPPLADQEKIIDHLNKSELLAQKRSHSISLLERYLFSVFLNMFGDPHLNSKGLPMSKFIELGTLERGKSKHRPRNAPELLGGPYPLIQTGDIANANGYIKSYKQTYSELGLKQSRIWPVGTLCITIAANIAKTAILTFEACFPDSVVGFTSNSKVRTEYIQYWLSFMQKMLEDTAPEAAQKNINLDILKKLEVPVPPIELQDQFVEVILSTNQLKQKMLNQRRGLENQSHSLMQKYFSPN